MDEQVCNKNVYSELLNKYFVYVYNYLLRLIKNKALAEDLTQETFLKAWLAFDRFDQTKQFKPWIFKIAHHIAVDYIRKTHEIPNEFTGIYDVVEAHQDKDLLKKEESIKIETELAALPVSQREAVYLYYIEEYDLNEVSRIIRKSKRATISLLQRARKSLRQKIIIS